MSATRANPRWKKLGFTEADYERLLLEQDGGCAICGAAPKTRRLHVDHDHRTGRVRGLLCHSCNRRLWTGATEAWLLAAAAYVRE